MPKLGMEPIRRRQLIEATIASIHEHGFVDSTVSRISAHAGVSAGIVHHYFEDKEALLEATLRSLAGELRREIVARLKVARSPRERVLAVVEGNLAPQQFTPAAVLAWLAFWSQVPTRARLARVQHVINRRTHSNLRHALRQLMPVERAERIAHGVACMLDGIWLRAALSRAGPDPAEARALAHDYVDNQLRE